MDRFLRPEKFEANPSAGDSTKVWKHWYRTYTNLIEELSVKQSLNKLNTLINYVAPSVYEYIAHCEAYEEAIETLTKVYVKPQN